MRKRANRAASGLDVTYSMEIELLSSPSLEVRVSIDSSVAAGGALRTVTVGGTLMGFFHILVFVFEKGPIKFVEAFPIRERYEFLDWLVNFERSKRNVFKSFLWHDIGVPKLVGVSVAFMHIDVVVFLVLVNAHEGVFYTVDLSI
jgi:hypothetical protein